MMQYRRALPFPLQELPILCHITARSRSFEDRQIAFLFGYVASASPVASSFAVLSQLQAIIRLRLVVKFNVLAQSLNSQLSSALALHFRLKT